MRKLILSPTTNLSTCVHSFQSRYMKLVLLSARSGEENFSDRRRRILNRCIISLKCILWLRFLCPDAQVHGSCSSAHQKSRVFSVASASTQTCYVSWQDGSFGERCVKCGVRDALPCVCCLSSWDVLLPTFPHRELLLPPALANWKQTSQSSAERNPTSGHGLLFHSENLDFAWSFSPQLFTASLDRVWRAGNAFSAAGKVNTKLTETWRPVKPWERIVKVNISFVKPSHTYMAFFKICCTSKRQIDLLF